MLANENHPVEVGPGYEVRDTNVRAVINFMIALGVLLILVQIGLWIMLKGLAGGVPEPHAALSMPPMADGEYYKLRGRETEILGKSAWVDKSAGKVRIPVNRAIELLSERGLPQTGAGKTEAEMNSHSGKAARAESAEGNKR